MTPLTSGINQAFNSPLAVKRKTKLQLGSAAPVWVPPDLGDSPTSAVCVATQTPFPPGIGNWTQLDASLPFDVRWIQLEFQCLNAASSALFDLELGTGVAASEVAWISGVGVRNSSVGTEAIAANVISLPCDPTVMASGVRFAARVRDEVLTAQRTLCIGWTLYR